MSNVVDFYVYRKTGRCVDPEVYSAEINKLCEEIRAGAVKGSLTIQSAVDMASQRATTSRENSDV